MTGLPAFTLIRFASVAVVALSVAASLDIIVWLSVVYSISFGHYIIGLVYSRKQIAGVMKNPRTTLAFVALLAGGVGMYLARLPLAYYFGLHHAVNEAYAVNRVTRAQDPEIRRLRGAGLFLHLFLFFALIRDSPMMIFADLTVMRMDPAFLFAGLGISYVAYFALLRRSRKLLSAGELINNCAFEILGLALLWASFRVRFTLFQVALYHYMFWMLFPLMRMKKEGPRPVAIYLALTLLVTGAFVVWSPMGLVDYPFTLSGYHLHFVLQSYFHITISFALSTANPVWIRRVFGEIGERNR